MKPMKKASGYLHIYLKKRHAALVGSVIGLIVLGLVTFIGYRFYVSHVDTSLNGSEVKEIHQNAIPADVLKRNDLLHTASISGTLRLPILMYHYVEYVQDKGDKTRISLDTLPTVLDAQIKTLSDAGYTFLTMQDVADILDGKRIMPAKSIVLTFDDGYQDFYTDAFPILMKYHAKATQYVISGFLDHQNHLTTPELQEIAKSGIVEIGAHTVHHIWLKGLSANEVTTEVAQSKVMLESIIGRAVVSFAYPFGAFDSQSAQITQSVGFKTSVSTVPGIVQGNANRYFLFRLRPGIRTGQDLLTWLNQDTFKPW